MEKSLDSLKKKITLFQELCQKCSFDQECIDFLDKLSDNSPISIACSGGSDSVCLLYFIKTHYARFTNVNVLHFNHNLRGENSEQDEIFVKTLSKDMKYLSLSERLNTEGVIVNEDTLREKRYEFFQKTMKSIDSNVLLLGQQKNDIAETIIMRLTRSSGTTGLSSPRPLNCFNNWQNRLRPLLTLKKSQIENILTSINQPWRTDESNDEEIFFRNRIRKNIIPELQKTIPQYDVIDSIASSRKLFQEDSDALDDIAARYLPTTQSNLLKTETMQTLPKAILRRLLYQWLNFNEIVLQKSNFEQLLESVTKNIDLKLNFTRNKFIIHKRNLLRISTENF